MSIKYAVFKEENDWEGETWRFYIRSTKANRPALNWLKDRLERGSEELESFSVSGKLVCQEAMCTLVSQTGSGYMSYQNELEGTLDIEELRNKDDIDLFAALYKGSIGNFMKK